jgi:hypothetical protein
MNYEKTDFGEFLLKFSSEHFVFLSFLKRLDSDFASYFDDCKTSSVTLRDDEEYVCTCERGKNMILEKITYRGTS